MARDAVAEHQDVAPPQEVHRLGRRKVTQSQIRPVVGRLVVDARPDDAVGERAESR